MSIKRNATLIEIREEDGAQCYRFGSDLNEYGLVWLCGSDRAQNAKLGDEGDLVYSANGSRGRWTFHAYEGEGKMMTHRIEEHECFDVLVKESGSDATFVKVSGFNLEDGTFHPQWVINLYRFTPSLGISTKKGKFVPNFCPMCGEDFRERKD